MEGNKMILTMQYPTSPYKVSVEVHDDVLVFNGTSYVIPVAGSYAELLVGFTEAYTPEFKYDPLAIQVQHKLLLRVLGINLPNETVTAIPVNDVPNPSPECQCGITCLGLNLAYVVVQNDPPDPEFVPPSIIPNPSNPSGGSTGTCNCKPCCSPYPCIATHIRCEFGWFNWFNWNM